MSVTLAASTVGCGSASNMAEAPAQIPQQFSEGGQQWKIRLDAPTNVDNRLIGTFFKKNPHLIGTPDWTGDPQKYVCDSSQSCSRFYWFSGSNQNPSWNAIEIKAGRFRQLNGVGQLGAGEPNE